MKKIIKFSDLNIRFILISIALLGVASCERAPDLSKLDSDAIILAFGDSLTRGKGANENESYPTILQKLSGRKVINAGISGELSATGLKRFAETIEKHSPDLIILCHGGNDILQKKDLNKMGDNIREMIKIARDKNLPVILLGVPRPGLFLSSADIYIEIAKTTDVIFIEELMADVLGDKSLKSDMAHPNEMGYRKIAEDLYALLQNSGAL